MYHNLIFLPRRLMKNPVEKLTNSIPTIESLLCYQFKDPNLLVLAFVHRSFINENKTITQHNERLEFLGDSILGMIISDYLYSSLPETLEGDLSLLRSRLVEASACARYIKKLSIDSYLLLGRGEKLNQGRGRQSIVADLFEAIVGAIFIDGGIESAKQFLLTHFKSDFDEILTAPHKNWKAMLQELCQKNTQQAPEYIVLKEEGPDHNKVFEIAVNLLNKELGIGKGASKKEAQQNAARDAIERLSNP